MTTTDEAGAAASGRSELELAPAAALELAVERHKAGALDEAETVYKALLTHWPDHPDVLNFMGILQQQRGDFSGAHALLARSLAAMPEAPGVWSNLGTALTRLRRLDEAEAAFRRSIGLAESPEAHSNLGQVLRRLDRLDEGEAACRRAIGLVPGFGDAWHNLSLVLLAQHRVAEAVQASNQAFLLLPPALRRRDSFGHALVIAGKLDEAAAVYREWLADEPDNPVVRHHLAACSGEATPERASDAYVEKVFDRFAASFDSKLARLHYRAPELVAAALDSALPPPAGQFDIADLGCGTGLCGPLVKGWARRLRGCDLSGAMLEQAQRRGVYQELKKAELREYLLANPSAFDVVVSADTLCYFGDLRAVAVAAHAALRAHGLFAFTVEALPAADAAEHRLLGSGRYAHGRAHLAGALTAAGFEPARFEAEALREEGGVPVQGWLVSARRGSGHDRLL